VTATLRLAARCYARYVAPLTLCSLVLFAPWLAFVVLANPPTELAHAKQLVVIAWLAGGTAWIAQYMMVGAAAPLVRALEGTKPSQLAALVAAIRGLAGAILPGLIVLAAVVMGTIALVIPGLVLLVLLALTAASDKPGLSEPLLDSVARVRAQWRPIAIAVAAILVVDLVVVVVPYLVVLGPLPAKPTPQQLATAKTMLMAIVIALPIVTPLCACVLAAFAVTARASE